MTVSFNPNTIGMHEALHIEQRWKGFKTGIMGLPGVRAFRNRKDHSRIGNCKCKNLEAGLYLSF